MLHVGFVTIIQIPVTLKQSVSLKTADTAELLV